jgi:hypothetical protein
MFNSPHEYVFITLFFPDLYCKKEKQHIDIQQALEVDCQTLTLSLDDLNRVLIDDKKKHDIMKIKVILLYLGSQYFPQI